MAIRIYPAAYLKCWTIIIPTLPGVRFGWSDYNEANGESWPALGDIDGDGRDEIIIGLGPQGAGRVQIFDYTAGKGLTPQGLGRIGVGGLQ